MNVHALFPVCHSSSIDRVLGFSLYDVFIDMILVLVSACYSSQCFTTNYSTAQVLATRALVVPGIIIASLYYHFRVKQRFR